MARRKKEEVPAAEMVAGADLSTKPDQTVIVWKATRPMSEREHESLSNKLRFEEKRTGMNIILVPYSVEASKREGDENAPD